MPRGRVPDKVKETRLANKWLDIADKPFGAEFIEKERLEQTKYIKKLKSDAKAAKKKGKDKISSAFIDNEEEDNVSDFEDNEIEEEASPVPNEGSSVKAEVEQEICSDETKADLVQENKEEHEMLCAIL